MEMRSGGLVEAGWEEWAGAEAGAHIGSGYEGQILCAVVLHGVHDDGLCPDEEGCAVEAERGQRVHEAGQLLWAELGHYLGKRLLLPAVQLTHGDAFPVPP